MGNIFSENKQTNKQTNKKTKERKIKYRRPKGEITTYTSYGLIFYRQDQNGGVWSKWGTKPWKLVALAKDKKDI